MSQTARPVSGRPDGEHTAELDHLRALLSDTLDLAAVVADDGSLSYLNRGGERLLMLPVTPAPGTLSALDIVAEGDRGATRQEIGRALREDGWWTGDLTLVSSTGSEVPTRSTLRVHRGEQRTSVTWIARDVGAEQAVYARLHKKIFEDELTGLPHRSIFLDRLDLMLRRRDADAEPVTLLFTSLDRFKEKNDRFGHEVGDALIGAVAQRLESLREPADMVSRWGGDEFVLLCEGTTTDPVARASEIIRAFEDPFSADGREIFLSASIGVATGRPGEVATDELLRRADAAGQSAKLRGGGTIRVFDAAMQERARRRAAVEDALRGAAQRDELVMHYQPEVDLRSGSIVAVESLVRWRHPEWGLVTPGEFIPVAELSNIILELGGWVIVEAMTQSARWRASLGDAAPTVAVNISARQFLQDDFVEVVATALARTGAEPTDICLEITEGVLMDDVELTQATLERLKALGVRLAVDDFGTGYSSLSYLRRFPVDVLKVDQSFVRGLGRDPEDSAIVEAVVHMGKALRLTTVAEGVETAHHVVELRELQCDLAQGYHFARPRPAEAVTRMLEAGPDWIRVTA